VPTVKRLPILVLGLVGLLALAVVAWRAGWLTSRPKAGITAANLTGSTTNVPGAPSSTPSESAPGAAAESALAVSTGAPTGTSTGAPGGDNVALDAAGGYVERIAGETGGAFNGRRLIDGDAATEPSWSPTEGPPPPLPTDIVISFYKHDAALVTAVVIAPAGNPSAATDGVPKDVEVWSSATSADVGFAKITAATLAAEPGPQTVSFSPVEARYVKVRILSVQGPDPARAPMRVGDIQVLEARRDGYTTIAARHPDLADWKSSARYAAQRGIDWLQPAALRWQAYHKCFGCHIQAQAVMGLAIAKKNDYIVSDQVIKDLIGFTTAQQRPDGSYEREAPGEPSTQFAAMALAHWDEQEAITANPALVKSVDFLLAKQKPSGELPYGANWCGSAYVVVQGPMMATANSLTAFERAFAETHDPRYRTSANLARQWIATTPPVTTQDKVFKILALTKFGGADAKAIVQPIVEQLIVEQHVNGGWRECGTAQFPNSNPLSTGQVLYAFKQAGVSISSSPFIKGVKYLLSTQRGDGSWPAETAALSTMGAPHATSMWAIIGLAGSFGTVKTGGLQIVTDLPPAQAAARRNLEIVLDLSGSMNATLGTSTRIETARRVLRDVLAKIPDDFNVGLRVYAHRYGSREKATCTDTELVSPIAKLDRQRLLSIAGRLRPRGETPLVYSILQAPADLKPLGGGSVIVITDGEESCGGDPTKAAQQLKDAGLPLTLNIVGFTLASRNVEQQLTAFAESTGGHYYSAQNGEALSRALLTAAVSTFPYTVYDAKGVVVAKGVAGPLAEALEPGAYRAVIQAGDRELTENVIITTGTDVILRVRLRGDGYVIER